MCLILLGKALIFQYIKILESNTNSQGPILMYLVLFSILGNDGDIFIQLSSEHVNSSTTNCCYRQDKNAKFFSSSFIHSNDNALFCSKQLRAHYQYDL